VRLGCRGDRGAERGNSPQRAQFCTASTNPRARLHEEGRYGAARSRWFPSDPARARDHLDQDEAPDLAARTVDAVGVGIGNSEESGVGRGRVDGGGRLRRFGGRRPRRREEAASDFEPVTIAGAEESRVTDLGETLGQDVSEEATDELLGREGGGLEIAGLVVAVVEAHGAVVGELIEAAVGDGDTEEIAAEVVEDLFAAASGFAVDDPGFSQAVLGTSA
jgi:hypothetical protein